MNILLLIAQIIQAVERRASDVFLYGKKYILLSTGVKKNFACTLLFALLLHVGFIAKAQIATTAAITSLVTSTCPVGSSVEWYNINTALTATTNQAKTSNAALAPSGTTAGNYISM
jgi:hypothetical protein